MLSSTELYSTREFTVHSSVYLSKYFVQAVNVNAVHLVSSTMTSRISVKQQ